MSDLRDSTEELLAGEEPEYYFHFRATLRIFGQIDDLDEITQVLGLMPTHAHCRGEKRIPSAEPYDNDMWSYTIPVPEEPA
jgi:hypothetical protein